MEKQQYLYRDPEKVIQYMDYQANPVPDNSRYVPEFVPGLLQPLEINEIIEDDPAVDQILANLDVESLVKAAEDLTNSISKPEEKDLQMFAAPAPSETMKEFG